MKTTFKFAGLSALLFGQSLCLLAQTAWHNPAADSLLPIQGRAWNAETGKALPAFAAAGRTTGP